MSPVIPVTYHYHGRVNELNLKIQKVVEEGKAASRSTSTANRHALESPGDIIEGDRFAQ